jgi:hypothetical protein
LKRLSTRQKSESVLKWDRQQILPRLVGADDIR